MEFPHIIVVDTKCLSLHFNVTYSHRVNDILCMRSYLVYQTLHILCSVVLIVPEVVQAVHQLS